MAESEGFEPSIEFPLYTLSRGAPSASRPTLHKARYFISLSDKSKTNQLIGRFHCFYSLRHSQPQASKNYSATHPMIPTH